MSKNRYLRKYEYTDNSKAYLDSLDKVALLMDKEIALKVNLWYMKIYQESIKKLDLVGYHYLLDRLIKEDLPNQLGNWEKKMFSLYMRARYYDNSISLYKKEDRVFRMMKDLDPQEVKSIYHSETDKVILLLAKHLRISTIKISTTFLKLTRTHCHKATDHKTCLYFKDDLLRAIDDRDFRVSYHKVNDLFTNILRKI